MPSMTTIFNTFQGMYGWSANNRSFRILMDNGSFWVIWTHCIASHGWRSTTWIPKGIPYAELELCWFFLIVLPLDGICINNLMRGHFSRCCSYDKPEFSTDFSICLCYLKSCKVFFVRVRERHHVSVFMNIFDIWSFIRTQKCLDLTLKVFLIKTLLSSSRN